MTRDRVRDLPYDLLKDASKRLEIMSLLAAVLWVLGVTGDRIALLFMSHGNRMWLHPQQTDIIAGTAIARIPGSVFLHSQQRSRSEVHSGSRTGVHGVYRGRSRPDHALVPVPKDWPVSPMISWIGAVVLMSAAIVPNTPEENPDRRADRGIDEPSRDADCEGPRDLGLRFAGAMCS